MHLKKVCCSYMYLIAAGRIDSRSALRHVQDGGCLFPSDAVIFGTRTFNTQGAWVHIAQTCWEPKQDEAPPFPKNRCQKKEQMIGTIQGGIWGELYKSEMDSAWSDNTMGWEEELETWISNFTPTLSTECWLQRVVHNACRKHQELSDFVQALYGVVISFRLTEKIKVENISSSMTSCLVWLSRNRKQSGAENGRPTQEVIDLKIHSYFRKQRTSKNIQNAFGFNFHNSFSLKTLKIHFSKGWGERIKVKFKSWASGYFSTGLTGTHEAATWTEEDL